MSRSIRNLALKRVKVYTLSEVWVDNGTGYCFGEVIDGKEPFLIVKSEVNQNDELLRAKIEGPMQFQRQQDTLIVWTDLYGNNIALSFQEMEGCSLLCEFIVSVHQNNLAPQISLISLTTSEQDGDVTEVIIGPVEHPILDPVSDDLPTVLTNFNENLNTNFQKTSIATFIKDHDYIHKLVVLFNINEKNRKIKNLHIICNIFKTLVLYNEGNIIELMLDDKDILGVVGSLEYDPDYPQYKANHRVFLQDDSRFKEILPVKNDHIKNLIKKTFKLQFLKDVVLARLLDDPTFNLISTLIHFNQVEIIKFLEQGSFIEEIFGLYQKNETQNKNENKEDDEESTIKKRDGIRLIHQFILISKNLQPHQKTSFYKSLIKKGLFKIIDFVLKDESVEIRVLGTEIIVSIIEHDILLINGVIETEEDDDHDDENDEDYEEDDDEEDDDEEDEDGAVKEQRLKPPLRSRDTLEPFNGDDYEKDDDYLEDLEDDYESGFEEGTPFFKTGNLILSNDMTLLMILTQFLLNDKNPGLRIQAFEALKSLLDPVNNLNIPLDPTEKPLVERLNVDNYFNAFYSKVAPKLFGPLIELKQSPMLVKDNKKDDLFIHLCELISFCSKDKIASRSFFLENHILTGISKLIDPIHKVQLRLAAVRYLKSVIQLNDDYYTRYIISNDSLRPVFEFLDETQGSGNLICSTILDLLEIILTGLDKFEIKKNYKLLANYIVSNFKESLIQITAVHSGEDLIKFVEQEYSHMSINQSSEYEDEFGEKSLSEEEEENKEEISTETILPNGSNSHEELTISPDSLDIPKQVTSPVTSPTLISSTLLRTTSNQLSSILTKADILKQTKVNSNKVKAEKRLREDEQDKSEVKKRSFKEKVQSAGKKLASKFSNK